MKWPADYHLHTPLCRHATGEPGEYAKRALAIGFTEIGFSDHSPMPRDDFDDWRMRADQLDEYVAKVCQAQKDFPNLTIRLALEVDYLPGGEDWICELTARHPWDYFIGSVHYVSDDWVVDNPRNFPNGKIATPFEVWSTYFERLTRAAETGFFEIIGHADLPKKFGHRPDRIARRFTKNFWTRPKRTIAPSNSTPPVCERTARKFIPAAISWSWRFRKACRLRSARTRTRRRKWG